jgi:hypothetical protein
MILIKKMGNLFMKQRMADGACDVKFLWRRHLVEIFPELKNAHVDFQVYN